MLLPSVILLNNFDGYGMSTVCASATPSGLTLAPANPGRTNLPPETLDFRPLRFSRNSRYLFRHSHFRFVHHCLRCSFTLPRNAPLPYTLLYIPSFGYMFEPRYIFGAESLDQ